MTATTERIPPSPTETSKGEHAATVRRLAAKAAKLYGGGTDSAWGKTLFLLSHLEPESVATAIKAQHLKLIGSDDDVPPGGAVLRVVFVRE
ncbi:MAG TPA: hypothetical protein VGR09_09540 [Gemmatimonadales bacterium]|nr:hypothetical protein [Gemmatimonadales bacterium]